MWTNLSSNWAGSNVHQAHFTQKANQILPSLEYSLLDLEGECSTLTNLYVLYASEGRQNDFFSILKTLSNHSVQSSLAGDRVKIEEFMHRLMIIKRTDGIYLSSKKCTDVFSLITNDHLELSENVKKIIKKIQSMKQSVTMHVTLGYLHSFAIDQRCENGAYYYYVYDPNSSVLPQKIFSLEELNAEIQNVLEKIKLSLGWRYFFYEDEAALFSFYIYPENEDEHYLSVFYQKLVVSPYKDDECVKEILNLIDLYRSNLIARNIVLIQIAELMSKSPRIQFYFSEDILAIEREISEHLYALAFNPVEHHKYKVTCFGYVKDYGHISLLHEVARIGDVRAVKALMSSESSDSCSYQEIYKTPVDWAIMGSHPLILDLLLGESKIQSKTSEDISRVVNCRANAFNFSNTESKAMGHAIFSMFDLIRSHQGVSKKLLPTLPKLTQRYRIDSLIDCKTEMNFDDEEKSLQRRYSF